MIQWLSTYNYNYAIAAVPIQMVLLIFYCLRRNLPIRRSRCFMAVMWLNLIMTVSDIAACEINEMWMELPAWVLYSVNIIYFITFLFRGWTLFDYAADSTQFYQFFGKSPHIWKTAQFITSLPALVVAFLVVMTPFTHYIFEIGESGYRNMELYNSIYFSTYYYIAATYMALLLRWKGLKPRSRWAILAFNTVLFLGIVYRKQFTSTLVTSYFSIIAILIIYLSAQNPDMYRDKITFLFSRSAFDLIVTEFLNKNIPFHMVAVTVDNYESARSIYGYAELTTSLREIGSWLVEALTSYRVFYFDNGNYLLMGVGDPDESKGTAERGIATLNERFQEFWKDIDTDIGLSLSALYIPSDMVPRELLHIHNVLRYSFRKVRKENRMCGYEFTDRMRGELRRQEAVEAALVRALQEKRIEAYFQPIYSTSEDRVVGAEALARLRDPELGFIPPLEFIQIAERTGAIKELGRQVFEQTCRFIATDRPDIYGLRFVNVNLSPAQCMNEELVEEMSEIAKKYDVSMRMFDFEITESSMDDMTMLKKQMLKLQSSGAELSLDDFGTGTSNLTRLLELPIHVVKLDMDIVLSFFSGGAKLLPDLVRMFQNASMEIVVEGVETAEMKSALASMGCNYEQGYYFSKPIPGQDFIEYLQAQV